MRRISLASSAQIAVLIAVLSTAPALAQKPSAPQRLSADEITSFAKVEVAIGKLRDSTQAQLAMARNKKLETQQTLRDHLRLEIDGVLKTAGMTPADYEHKLMLVSTDTANRRTFDMTVAKLTGVPTPGQIPVVAMAPAGPATKVPAGPVGVHLGHVLNGFGDTPGGQGLLPVAVAEAKMAAQHATLASNNLTNLAAMKMHAGHVLNAIDPTQQATGPGLGYGVKRAALNIATHIDLAAKTPGASENVTMHAGHAATAARTTAARCDQAIAIAKQIQAAMSVTDASALVSQLVSLVDQLGAGFDANNDGKVTWQDPEGGLLQVEDHIKLLLKGEGIMP